MQTIGIIGGLGPETSSKFYLELLYQAFKLNQLQRPAILMWSIPMEYQIEKDFILGSDQSAAYINYLVDAAKRLEAGGADFIVIPCNSVHIFIKQVRSSVNIPVLSIVEETGKYLIENRIKNVGLLATQASLNDELYQKEFMANGIETVLPSKEDQERMGLLINKLVRNEYSEIQKEELMKIIDTLSNQDLDVILLACTDLQLLTPKHEKVEIIDTMKILVAATVRKALL